MRKPAAKQGDTIVAIDTHLVIVPPVAAPVPTPLPFKGTITANLSPNVRIMGMPAATVGSIAINIPPHIVPPPGSFVKPPANRGTIVFGSATVKINGKMAARLDDQALTCNDPVDLPVGRVIAKGTVFIG
ncbi:MAG: hypothetical protein HC862_08010 [Scytonema sp. RU_4_4]|nr:hypothetical protein [Scytonema sp. RU_4_4]NJR76392.1 hypothetical protein [Scytonema sp. CRU_2_7]